MSQVIDIVSLYPKYMNIYGDSGNVLTIQRRLALYGYEPRVHAYNQGCDWPEHVDMILGGGGQDTGQKKIIDDFFQRADLLRSLAADGVPMLMICGLYQLFGEYFETVDGSRLDGIGVIGAYTVGQETRMIGNLTETSADFGKIIGYENHSGQTFLRDGVQPLGTVEQDGTGNNGEDHTEGARVHNVIGTYMHGSLLPKYRGAAPIQWAVLNGDAVTGVSTMYLDREMDTGDVIYTEQTPVGEFETAGELFDRLAVMGADLLVRTLRDIDAGAAPRTPQDHSAATYTRPLTRDDSPIDWDQSPRAIIKHICGLEPWPVATAELGGQTFKIHAADYSDRMTRKAPGTIVAAGKDGVTVACADGQTVRITQLQAPGKKRMSAADYLLGHTLPVEG